MLTNKSSKIMFNDRTLCIYVFNKHMYVINAMYLLVFTSEREVSDNSKIPSMHTCYLCKQVFLMLMFVKPKNRI